MSDQPQPAGNGNGRHGIARSVVNALRRDPLMLAFMLLMMVLLWLIYQSISKERDLSHAITSQLIKACIPVLMLQKPKEGP